MIINISAMTPGHWTDVRRIYLEGIASGNATFEIEAPSWEQWNRTHHVFARLVATVDGTVKGWAALSPVSTRNVYAGVAEVSVYIANDSRGLGLGKQLLNALVRESEMHGIWTLQASIFPENLASLRLHKRCGFREVGQRQLIGKMAERWRSTVLVERRSKVVGT